MFLIGHKMSVWCNIVYQTAKIKLKTERKRNDVDKNFELFRKACSQNHPESDHRHIHAAEA